MLQDHTPGVEDLLKVGPVSGYVGFDPTADSLHVGNLVPIMLLVHFQRCGHRPIALVGGATGMVGDPSGKKAERNLLSEEVLAHNVSCIRAQLECFLDFSDGATGARMVNNYDWFKDMGFLRFIRDVGKHITVNYMMAKDSVKKRLETGISFTEFSYQLVQGYDFHWLYTNMDVKLQLGGSDQWGNITTGTELIRRMDGGDAHAITTPLLTKADGSKFGKSESGNVWLDKNRTSVFDFYQFWLNTSDSDAERYIRIFTVLEEDAIRSLVESHRKEPHKRRLQQRLALEVTARVHGEQEADRVMEDTNRIFSQRLTRPDLVNMNESDFLAHFGGLIPTIVPHATVDEGVGLLEFLSDITSLFPSRGEVRRAIKENSLRVNQRPVEESKRITRKDLVGQHYILIQRGKKKFFLVKVG